MIQSSGPEPWLWDVLLELPVKVAAVRAPDDRADLELTVTAGDGAQRTERYDVKHFTVLKPSTVHGMPHAAGPVLVVTRRVSPDSVEALRVGGHSWVSLHPLPSGLRGELRIGDQLLELKPAPALHAEAGPSPGPGRPGTSTAQVMQELLWRGTVTQSELTSATGLSQARVSQVLNKLAKQPWLTAAGGRPVRWRVTNVNDLVDHWLTIYRPTKSVATFWYSLESLQNQVQAAIRSVGPSAWVSGGMAADALVPWSVPQSALIYTSSMQDLSRSGLVPSQVGEASLQLVITQDLAVPPSDSAKRVIKALSSTEPAFPVADPLVVLWDLDRSRDVDAHQSAQRFREALLGHLEADHAS